MKSKIYLTMLIFLPFLSMAQTDTAKAGSTIIFYNSPQSTVNRAPVAYNNNAIKFGIFDIFSGLYGVHYERELGSLFSLQAGIGLTGRNFAAGIFGEDESDNFFIRSLYNGPDAFDLPDYYYDYKARKSILGFFVSIHPKFYYNEDGFEGPYMGLIIAHRKYNYEAFDVDNSVTQYASDPLFTQSRVLEEFEKNLIMALSWGSQAIGDKIALDYNVALGMKKISGERRDVGQVRNSNYEMITVAALNDVAKTSFYFEMSLKIGLHWSGGGSGNGI